MSGYDAMQWTIIALAVLASASYAIHKLAPRSVRRVRTEIALVFLQSGRGPSVRRFGRWLAPKPQAGGGCGGGSCDGCETKGDRSK